MSREKNSLNTLVERLFDYSGMFPPESKTFEAALADSAGFGESLARPYLVNIDIVLQEDSIRRLSAARLLAGGFDRNVTVAYLGSGLTEAGMERARAELSFARDFNDRGRPDFPAARIGTYEIKIERPMLRDDVMASLEEAAAAFHCSVCIEPDLSREDWRETLGVAAGLLSRRDAFSLKIRATGPSGIGAERIAEVIQAAAAGEVHLKATGGMHHPILEPARYQNAHGFLNFAAALLFTRALGGKFPLSAIRDCLDERDANSYSFGDGIRWRSYGLCQKTTELLKAAFRMSIGSCSIREPDDDLLRLFPSYAR